MNIATVDNLPAQSNRAVSNPRLIAQGVIWGSLAVVVLSGWFVVTRMALRQDLRVWDVMALRFGEGAVFLTPVLLVGPLRLRVQAWPSGIVLALLWGVPFILLVGFGLQATSATMTSTVTPALMPVFAGFVAWTFFGERPSTRQLSGYGMIAAGLFALVCVYVQTEGRLDIGGAAALVTAAVLWAVYTLRPPGAGVTSRQAAALIRFWSAIPYLPLYLGLSPLEPDARVRRRARVPIDLSGHHDERCCTLCLQSRRPVARTSRGSCDHRTCAGHGDHIGEPVLGEWPSWPSAAAVCIIALGVGLAATSSNQANKKGESQ